MVADRHRQLGFACDPAGTILLAGDRVEVVCPSCGSAVGQYYPIARTFETGSVTVFDAKGKQRHVHGGRFRASGAPA